MMAQKCGDVPAPALAPVLELVPELVLALKQLLAQEPLGAAFPRLLATGAREV